MSPVYGAFAAFSSCEPDRAYRGRMDTPDNHAPADRPDPTKLEPTFGHLFLPDTRTPEERRAASLRESARRKGRSAGKWWDKPQA